MAGSSSVRWLLAAVVVGVLPVAVAVSLQKLRRQSRTLFGSIAGGGGRADTTVVKLGGSAITDKQRFEVVDLAGLTAAAESLKRLVSEGRRVVVVHGAGSFGHFQAKEFGISRGGLSDDSWRLGFALTRRSVTKLNGEVVQALTDAGVPAVAVAAFPRLETWTKALRDDAATREYLADIRDLLDKGFCPVLHGDAVVDADQRCAILSGDALLLAAACDLAERGRLAATVFCTDVDGVYTRPPDDARAELVKRVDVDARSGELLPLALETETADHDVTGGIAAKLSAAARVAAATRLPVDIVRVGTAAADLALRGSEPDRATRVAIAGPTNLST